MDHVAFARKYFVESRDKRSRIWIFSEEEPSSFLRGSVQFGHKDFTIHIVDQFAGRQPILLNYEAFTADEIQIPFRPTAILDANVVSNLHRFVTSPSRLASSVRQAVEEFLRFVVRKRFDYNPFFYYIEGAAKNDDRVFLSYAVPVTQSILTLHTMDGDYFLETGKISTLQSQLEFYEEEYKVKGLEVVAAMHARAMVCPLDRRIDGLSRLIYASLLKTAVIHRSSRRPIHQKYEELLRFFGESLDIAMGIERVVALIFFCGQFDSFIPIQSGSRSGRVLERLRATAWDLVLLRLPTRMLVADDNEVTLGYVTTSDRALRQAADACQIEAVVGLEPKRTVPLVFLRYDFALLGERLGRDTVNELRVIDEDFQRRRVGRLGDTDERISWDTLIGLTELLESDVARLCGS